MGSFCLQMFTKVFKQLSNGLDRCMCSSDLIVCSWFSLCDPQGIKIQCYSPECTSNCCATYPTLASTLPICQLAQLLLPIVFVLTFAFVFEFVFVLRYKSSSLKLYKELSSSIFQSLWVSESVRHAWHPSRSPFCAIYKGIDALY